MNNFMKKIAFISLIILIFVVSGCGKSQLIIDDGIIRSDIQLMHNKQRCLNKQQNQLKYDPTLEKYAQKWAEWMATKDNMVHSNLDTGGTFNYVGENIAMGYEEVDEVMDGWMNSKGHRQNILSGNYTHIGLGYARMSDNSPYWCALFGGDKIGEE